MHGTRGMNMQVLIALQHDTLRIDLLLHVRGKLLGDMRFNYSESCLTSVLVGFPLALHWLVGALCHSVSVPLDTKWRQSYNIYD